MSTDAQQKVKAAALQKLQTKSVAKTVADAEQPDSPEEHGIQDLLEVIVFIEALAETVVEALADGIGPLDVITVFGDEEVREAVGPAVRDASDIGAEVTDLSAAEIQRLLRRVTDMAFSVWDALTTELLG